ncbi:coiled-coil domain-containing protein 42 like-2 isoform X1 [Triplophysa dalaica]|uniref:coiled-coil domain-containing protein 42 like-2 isoform X1 n=1 Tax=Triplophysa dalaica TaxID=1582913 RepID=UPI0024DF669C|nr:coiled-coil domain-containing protein 42 like-2 isoform X1 [Triplophysa dalaica]
MNLNLDDYIRTIFEEQLSLNEAEQQNDSTSVATMLLEKRQEEKRVDRDLNAQKEELEKQREGFRRRKEDMMKEEEKLKAYVLSYDPFLKENYSKQTLALRKAEAEKAQIRLKIHTNKELQIELEALHAREMLLEARVKKASIIQRFLESAVKMSVKFESIGQLIAHCQLILSIREQLVNKQTAAEKERERIGLELRRRKNEQSVISLDCSIKLAQQQTRLDNIRAQAHRLEDIMKRIQSTAAKETLLLGQIRVTILNLYYMISKGPVDVENSFAQLEKIHNYFLVRTGADKMKGHSIT